MEPPPLKPPAKPRSKALLYTGLGCGTVILLMLAVAGFLVFRIFSHGKRIPVTIDRVVTTNSLGVLHLKDTRSDPGVSLLLAQVIELSGQLPPESAKQQLPNFTRWLQRLGTAKLNGIPDFARSGLPEIILSVESPGPDQELQAVTVLRFFGAQRFITSLIPYLLNQNANPSNLARTEYRGYTINTIDPNGTFAFVGNSVLMGGRMESIQGVLDRLDQGPEAGTLLERIPLYADPGWDLCVGLQNPDNRMGNYLEGLTKVEDAEINPSQERFTLGPEITQAALGLDVVSADELHAELEVRCSDTGTATRIERQLSKYLQDQQKTLESTPVKLHFDARQEEAQIRIDLKLTGLQQWLQRAINDLRAETELPQ